MTSSRLGKEQILKNNLYNDELKCVLEYSLNPFKIYGIGKKSINDKYCGEITIDQPKNLYQVLGYLLEHNTGTDYDKRVVNNFLATLDDFDREWCTRIILKDLRIGATSKTINKIFPNLIPLFEVMLAKKYMDFVDRDLGEFIITEKLDGIRCVIIKDCGRIQMLSRQGQFLLGFHDIIEEAKMYLPDNYVFDGELLLENTENLKSKDLYRKTMKEVSKDGRKDNVQFHMFDLLPLDEFKNGKSRKRCIQRKFDLHDILDNDELKWIVEVPILYIGKDKNEVTKLLNKAIMADKEGVMLNNTNGLYECKRSSSILKCKVMQSCDCRIVGFQEGDGKYKDTLGAIIIEYKNKGNIVKVGSGYTDEDRRYIWNNRDKLLNTIAEIQYFEETTNQSGDGRISLRFPVFLRLRSDKTEESYY